jgi:glycerol-3-phosphate dehydrogenase
MSSSYHISRSKVLGAFPLLTSTGLVGAVVYYGGMRSDARVNLALILAAIKHGEVATNHTEVIELQKGGS